MGVILQLNKSSNFNCERSSNQKLENGICCLSSIISVLSFCALHNNQE